MVRAKKGNMKQRRFIYLHSPLVHSVTPEIPAKQSFEYVLLSQPQTGS